MYCFKKNTERKDGKTVMKIKKYYRIIFKLTSPLSVGSGESNITDSDIILDSRGVPYIPGTALAGVYRTLFEEACANRYFGVDLTESKVVVYDATIRDPKNRVITTRDMVALDEYKVSIDGAKFDFQVLEPGVEFVTYVEQNMDCMEEQYMLNEIACAWQKKKIQLGAKTGRGYGHTEVIELAECSYDLTGKEQRDAWLDFNMYGEDGWKTCDMPECLSTSVQLQEVYDAQGIEIKEKEELVIELELKQRGGISIRQYSTNVGEEDYKQMARSDKDETPFIPGTTWAGAFRAQMGKLDASFAKHTVLTELIFGNVKGNQSGNGQKTRITFSESELKGGRWEKFTRNSINRFSNGTVDKALYTEKAYFDGVTTLQIGCDISKLDKAIVKGLGAVISGAILDLDKGYMAVGGLTSVGHGLFQVLEVSVNGKKIGYNELSEEERFSALKSAIYGEEE